jgi:hypothetical protein
MEGVDSSLHISTRLNFFPSLLYVWCIEGTSNSAQKSHRLHADHPTPDESKIPCACATASMSAIAVTATPKSWTIQCFIKL